MLGQYRGILASRLLNLVQHNTFFNIKDHLAPLIKKKNSTSRAGRNFIWDKKQLLLPTASEITSLMN